VRSDAPARGLFRTPGPCFRGGLPSAFAALARPPFQPHHPGFPGSSRPAREGMCSATALAAEFALRKFGVGEKRYWEMAPPAFAECRWHSAAEAPGGRGRIPEAFRDRAPVCATAEAALPSRGRDRILTAPPARGDGGEYSPRWVGCQGDYSSPYLVITGRQRPARRAWRLRHSRKSEKRGLAAARPGDPYGLSANVELHHGWPGQARP
jgi:hypothetical protein